MTKLGFFKPNILFPCWGSTEEEDGLAERNCIALVKNVRPRPASASADWAHAARMGGRSEPSREGPAQAALRTHLPRCPLHYSGHLCADKLEFSIKTNTIFADFTVSKEELNVMGNKGLDWTEQELNPGPASQSCVTLLKSLTSLGLRFFTDNMRIIIPPSMGCLKERVK